MRRILFDTSVVVPALTRDHPANAKCLPWLRRCTRGEAKLVICAHTLAETYGILTRLPVPYRIVPTMAEELIRRSVLPHAHVVALSEDDYLQAIERVAGVGLTGAVIYDALLLAAATKAKAHHILTSDTHHFSMLSPETEGFILAP